MNVKLDIDRLEQVYILLNSVNADIIEFECNFLKLKKVIEDEYKGQVVTKCARIETDLLPIIKYVGSEYLKYAKVLNTYIEKLHTIDNEDLDINTIKESIVGVENEVQKIAPASNDMQGFYQFQAKYEQNASNYYRIDKYIDISPEYNQNASVKELVLDNRVENNAYIENYENNQIQLQQAQLQFDKLNDTIEKCLNDLDSYKQILTELEEFEHMYKNEEE